MPSTHYETIRARDPHRAAVLRQGTLILSRWADEGIPDGFFFSIEDAPIEAMEAIACAINAAIDAAHEVRAKKEAA